MVNDNSLVGFGGALIAVTVIWSLVGLLIFVWYLWSLARLFPYLGLPAAHGWIPVFNQWRLIERGGYPGWLILLAFVPGANIVAVIFLIMAIHRINQENGQGAGMTVLGAFIAPLWATILGSRLQARGHAGGAGYAPHAGGWQAPQQEHVEYGPDGQVYPLLGGAAPAPGVPAQGYVDQGFAAQGYADQQQAAQGFAAPNFSAPGQAPDAQQSGWAMPPAPPLPPQPSAAPAPAPSAQGGWAPPAPPVFDAPAPAAAPPAAFAPQPEAQAVSNLFADPEASVPAAPSMAPGSVPGAAPGKENPWSLGSTVDGNFERLANEALPPRDASFGGVDARPFSWPEPQPAESLAAPAATPAPPAAPVAVPLVSEVPSALPVAAPAPAPAPVTPAPAAPQAAASQAPALDDEFGATVVTGGAVAPIANDDDLDHTIMVSRKARWVLELADGALLELEGDDIVLGRRPSAIDGSEVLTVPDTTRTLSKSHARLRRAGEVWTIEDLNSTNGVFVFNESGAQIELVPGAPQQASEQLIIGTLEVSLRAIG